MSKKILIIDGDPVFVNPVKVQLLSLGYQVITAFDGVTGYELAQKMSPDLITLDITVPALNGYSVCGFLKSHEVYKSIPIIMLSAETIDPEMDFMGDIKPDAVFFKPCSIDRLLQKVKELIGG